MTIFVQTLRRFFVFCVFESEAARKMHLSYILYITPNSGIDFETILSHTKTRIFYHLIGCETG